MLSTEKHRLLIDAGVANLVQLLDERAPDAVLLTHYHVDHVHGLFTMRWGYCDTAIPVYGPDDPEGCADLLKHPGIFDFTNTLQSMDHFSCCSMSVTPLSLNHSKPSLGYAIESGKTRLAWLCDTSGLPEETHRFLQHWQPTTTVLDCTFPPLDNPHQNHNDIFRAIDTQKKIGSGNCYLTHIGHELDCWLMENSGSLPDNVAIARDEMVIDL